MLVYTSESLACHAGIFAQADASDLAVLQHNLFTLASHPSPSLYPTNAFRTYAWIPLILHGYTVAAAASQACVVVCHRTSALQQFSVRPSSVLRPLSRVSRLPRPMVVNTIFWSGLVVLTLMLVVCSTHLRFFFPSLLTRLLL